MYYISTSREKTEENIVDNIEIFFIKHDSNDNTVTTGGRMKFVG